VLQKIEYKPDADDERLRRLTLTKHLLAVMIPTVQTKVNFQQGETLKFTTPSGGTVLPGYQHPL